MEHENPLIQTMKNHGTPITRENFIELNWGEDIPNPWTAEDEEEIPESLRDWSKVDKDPRQK